MVVWLDEIREYFFKESDRWIAWVPVLFGLGIGGYFLLPVEPSQWITLVVLEILLFMAFIWRRKPGLLIFVAALLLIVMGFMNIQFQANYKSKHIERINDQKITYIKGQIVRIDKSSSGKVRLMLDDAADFDKALQGKFRITLSSRRTDLQEGQCVELVASLMPNYLPALPQTYQFDRKAFFEGLSASGYALSKAYIIDCDHENSFIEKVKGVFQHWRRKVILHIAEILPPDEAGIAAAIVAGDKTGIRREITDNYRNSGLAHFLSISGLHMSLIAGMAFFVMRLLLAFVQPISRRYNLKAPSAVMAIFVSFVYLIISGAEIPSQRAFIMTFVVLLGVIFDRRAISMRMVSFAAFVVLIITPQALISAGFQMSFAAVVVLIAFYERYASSIHKLFAGKSLLLIICAYIFGLLISDFVASLATLPFAIYHFNQVAVYTSLGNLLAGPVIGFVIMPFVLLSLIAMPFGGEVFPLKVVGLGIHWVNEVTAWVSHLPGAGLRVMSMPLWGLMALVIGGLWLCIWNLKWRKLGFIPVVIGLFSLFLTQKPDVLYDSEGKTIALKDQNENIVVMPAKRNKWLENIWLEKTISHPLSKSEKQKLKKIYSGKAESLQWIELKCSENECSYKNIFSWQKNGDLFLKGEKILPDEDGGGVIYIDSRKAKKATVCGDVGKRLWNSCGKIK